MIKDTAVQILLEHFSEGMVRTIVDAIAEDEREACAKTCENIALGLTKWPKSFEGLTAETKLMRSMGEFVHKPFVDAIRARGQE